MRINLDTFEEVHSPMYVVEEAKLRRNLELIVSVATRADVEIILAFKAFALWKTFPIFKEYIRSTTASSLSEAKLAFEEFGSRAHTYSPAYTDDEIGEIALCSSHLTFNSLTQYVRFAAVAKHHNEQLSFGLRVNPEYSEVETDLYNPCAQNVCQQFYQLASRGFIAIVIAKAVLMCSQEHYNISRASSQNGFPP